MLKKGGAPEKLVISAQQAKMGTSTNSNLKFMLRSFRKGMALFWLIYINKHSQPTASRAISHADARIPIVAAIANNQLQIAE